MNHSNLRICILAAGKGTRMNSNLPKVLHKINNKTLLQFVIETSESLNPAEIILIVGYKIKWVASVMALFTLSVAIIFHTDFSGDMQMMLFLKDLAIAGGFLILIANKSGKISLDYYFYFKSKQE